jgi:3-methyladenine DNA glycosylase/8-oxoguanine DNA glycosylase
MVVNLSVPSSFNLWRTVYSHGWCALPPFVVDKDHRTLSMIIETSAGKAVPVTVGQLRRGKLHLQFQYGVKLSAADRKTVAEKVKSVLRLDEDFSEFYKEARKHKTFRWVPGLGAGRLLRAPTVFEDVVKMICTTNCSWALTETMVENLCNKLGFKVQSSMFAFPKPETLADCSERFLRKEIRSGYRAPYLRELGQRIVKGDLNVEAWRQSTTPTEELYKEVCSAKGIGPYAAGNILKLLGRYDYLAIDSWCRKKFFKIHKNGRNTTDRAIEKFYLPFGKWRGLFFWMDVTKDWYERESPF